jgi:2-methylisocitrate lyase-like PEP mutase family enzyme
MGSSNGNSKAEITTVDTRTVIKMKATARLRELLVSNKLLLAPGAYDGITARLVEQAGFPAVYMTGAGTAAAHGYPDYGLVTMSEMVATAATMARSVAVPVVADADTGYGNELNVTRTVREYEAHGVAGIHIEDQVLPKRCGHLDGKDVVPRDVFLANIRAAVSARRDPDFLIIARSDAGAVEGLDEAIARVNLALAAGADMAFVEATRTLEEISAVPKRVKGPCLLNIVPGGKTPPIDMEQAQEMGYRLAIFPGLLLTALITAGDEALRTLKETGKPPATPMNAQVGNAFRRMGSTEWDALRTKFQSATASTDSTEI